MKTSILEHKDPDVFWLRVCLLVEVEFVVFSLWTTTFSNLKTYLSSAWNTFSVVISNIFGKKRNSIVTFQSGHLTEQPKTLDDLGCFDLKMFRNCPIKIEIITGGHIFILFLPRLSLYAFILPLAVKYSA